MNFVILFQILLSIFVADFQIDGTIEVGSWLEWVASPSTNVIEYNVYAARTNETNFALVAKVTNTAWQGSNTLALSGVRTVYVTAISQDAESDPSNKKIVMFNAGRPLPPGDMFLKTALKALATNALPNFQTNSVSVTNDLPLIGPPIPAP